METIQSTNNRKNIVNKRQELQPTINGNIIVNKQQKQYSQQSMEKIQSTSSRNNIVNKDWKRYTQQSTETMQSTNGINYSQQTMKTIRSTNMIVDKPYSEQITIPFHLLTIVYNTENYYCNQFIVNTMNHHRNILKMNKISCCTNQTQY